MEYIIWGQTNLEKQEQILCTKVEGELITNRSEAEKIAKVLTEKHGCLNVRIQEVDLSYPQSLNKYFTKSINI